MRNVHRRQLAVPAAQAGALLERLARDDDPLWPSPAWVPLRLDRPLAVGAEGGHGKIRYRVVAHDPGVRVRFAFDPRIGIDGWHELRVEPIDARSCRMVHELRGTTRATMALLWPTVVRPLHDALIEDLLDNAELATNGHVDDPATWNPWVQLLQARLAQPT